ncbi:scopoletin glucosyltransferase-like [Cornus florida]|uniref:scopoletin glucosyltransferase-like n=1 Tax=Cornus florida TaxID=4283 RepID=UPI00289F8263|nr:scopoletin glucosyltransferase-like [Cornus florida]
MVPLHVLFFPLMAHGHMIPTLDMAKLFASRGVKTTIVTTPLNAPIFTTNNLCTEINIRVIKFPTLEAGLPAGVENAGQISDDMTPNFVRATIMLQEPLEQVLQEEQPHCLVADIFFPWATKVAAKFDIPRIAFHGTSFFAACASESMRLYKPHMTKFSSWTEPFVIPNLPHQIELTAMQIAVAEHDDQEDSQTDFNKLVSEAIECELASYGVIVNSFYDLEPAYADHYSKVFGRKAWHIGPVSLCNTEFEDKACRGSNKASINEHEYYLNWLNSKKPNSVIYVCFGSIAKFSTSQLCEIAMGLENSGQQFIWVVRKGGNQEGNENWLPKGFEERMEGKGLVIRGWAAQVLILEHEAIGGFVTHCGWNSTLEGVCAGVPMVTWPMFAEQFFNEKLVTEVLRIGVGVGAQQWNSAVTDGVMREAIEEAVRRIMVGEEAEEMRSRAMAMKGKAIRAVEEGGSSYCHLNALIEELSSYCVLEASKI